MKILPHCNELTGWYTASGLESLRRFVLEVINKRVDYFIQKNSFKFEKFSPLVLDKEELLEQRMEELTKFMRSPPQEIDALKTTVDISTVWLKKYLQNASHSETIGEDDVLRSYGSAPIAKSGIYNRGTLSAVASDVKFMSPPTVATNRAITSVNNPNLTTHKELDVSLSRIEMSEAFGTLVDENDSEYSD